MTVLNFEAALQDERLIPLTQLGALAALDGTLSPFGRSPLVMSRIYRAALAPACRPADATDPACVCAAVLRDVCVGSGGLPGLEEIAELTPAFIARSSDRGGYFAERRLLVQLENRRRMAWDIISSSSSLH